MHPVVRTLLRAAVLAAAALPGCAPAPGTEGAPPPPANGYVRTIHAEEVDLWRGVNYRGLLLDVRNPDEWEDTPGLLEGATRIPLGDLQARMPEIAGQKGRPALVFDATGPRGQAGAQILARAGFADVGWVDGGIEAYRLFLVRR